MSLLLETPTFFSKEEARLRNESLTFYFSQTCFGKAPLITVMLYPRYNKPDLGGKEASKFNAMERRVLEYRAS
jgi:hypothetical protein